MGESLRNFKIMYREYRITVYRITFPTSRANRTHRASRTGFINLCSTHAILTPVKHAGGCPPTQTPTQKNGFDFQFPGNWFELSVSAKMIFGALQSELFRFKTHSLGSKILKFPEFNLYSTLCDVIAKLKTNTLHVLSIWL